MILAILLAVALCPHPHRSKAVLREFIKQYQEEHEGRSCPLSCATFTLAPGGKYKLYRRCGACALDHSCPIACGGKDAPENLHWLSAKANLAKGADCSACKEPFYQCGTRK